MATIKSYTDIKQSRKLAEFLPIESADMCLTFVNNIWNPVWGKSDDIYKLQKDCYEPDYTKDDYVDIDEFEPKVVPCWSLATLLNLIPEYIKFNDHIWKFYLDHCGMYYMNADTYDINTFSSSIGVLIDDAFEIILKLKEKNLL